MNILKPIWLSTIFTLMLWNASGRCDEKPAPANSPVPQVFKALSNAETNEWVTLLSSQGAGTVVQTPALDEDEEGVCFTRDHQSYFAIFNPDVQNTLLSFLDQNVPNDAVFSVRLSQQRTLGYGLLSRLAYMQVCHVDPKDLYYWSNDPDVEKWFAWRQQTINGFMAKVSGHLRAQKSKVKLAVRADYLVAPDTEKKNSCEDWPTWVKSGLVDEIVLEGEWEKPENKRLVGLAAQVLAGTPVKLRVAFDLRRDGKALDPLGQLLNLQGEKIDGVVLKIENPGDASRAQTFVKDSLPEFQFGLG